MTDRAYIRDYSQWQTGNDTPRWIEPRKTVWFLYRYPSGVNGTGRREDYRDTRGNLITWTDRENAERFASQLQKRIT